MLYGALPNIEDRVLTRHRRRDRVVVLCTQRVVYFDFFRKLLDGETGQTPSAEFFRRRRVHLHVSSSRQYLLAYVQHTSGNVQVVMCNEIATHFARPPDAFFERRSCINQVYTYIITYVPYTPTYTYVHSLM